MSVYAGQSFVFSHLGHSFRAVIEPDDYAVAPWENGDGNLEVMCVTSGYKKSPSEVFLYKGNRNCWSYVYDLRLAIDKAKQEGWGPARPGETRGQTAVRTVRENAQFLRDWCSGEWPYVGVIVTRLDGDGSPAGEPESLWSVESCGDYAEKEVSRELAEQCLAQVTDTV